MTEKLELYRCNVCGNLVQVVLSGAGELVCCEERMVLLTPHQDELNELSEKHVPEIENNDGKTLVTLRKHPMLPEHYIQFIEVCSKDKSHFSLKYLEPNDNAEFDITNFSEEFEAIEYCNIHGLWKNK